MSLSSNLPPSNLTLTSLLPPKIKLGNLANTYVPEVWISSFLKSSVFTRRLEVLWFFWWSMLSMCEASPGVLKVVSYLNETWLESYCLNLLSESVAVFLLLRLMDASNSLRKEGGIPMLRLEDTSFLPFFRSIPVEYEWVHPWWVWFKLKLVLLILQLESSNNSLLASSKLH